MLLSATNTCGSAPTLHHKPRGIIIKLVYTGNMSVKKSCFYTVECSALASAKKGSWSANGDVHNLGHESIWLGIQWLTQLHNCRSRASDEKE